MIRLSFRRAIYNFEQSSAKQVLKKIRPDDSAGSSNACTAGISLFSWTVSHNAASRCHLPPAEFTFHKLNLRAGRMGEIPVAPTGAKVVALDSDTQI
jgi:hypothetical protein